MRYGHEEIERKKIGLPFELTDKIIGDNIIQSLIERERVVEMEYNLM